MDHSAGSVVGGRTATARRRCSSRGTCSRPVEGADERMDHSADGLMDGWECSHCARRRHSSQGTFRLCLHKGAGALIWMVVDDSGKRGTGGQLRPSLSGHPYNHCTMPLPFLSPRVDRSAVTVRGQGGGGSGSSNVRIAVQPCRGAHPMLDDLLTQWNSRKRTKNVTRQASVPAWK